jgi:predicted O-methyltransferase YrrM
VPAFSEKLSLVRGYLHHWLHALNEHSLQAPFVYDLYGNIIKNDRLLPAFQPIEATRHRLLHCPDQITVSRLGAPSRVSAQPIRRVSSVARHGLSSAKFGRLLYRLATYNASNYLLELGTSLGITTLYLAAARPSGVVYTLEGGEAIADRAERVFGELAHRNIHLVRGDIDRTLPDLLQRLPRVDFAYLDANHRYGPTVAYFEQVVAKTDERSIVVVDDIYWSGEMQHAWRHIRQHPAVTLTLDLFDAGLVFFTPLSVRQHYVLMF